MSNIRVTYTGLISLITGLISLVIGLIVILIITRGLTPEEFGKEDGFLKYPYEEFYDGWINNIDNKTLLIFYKDLIENPKRTINKIEEFYGLNRSKKVKLPKMNYSRSGAMNLQRKIFIQFRKIKLLRNMRNNYFPEELKRLTAV